LLQLSWIDKLVDNVRTLFTTLYREEFKKPYTSIIVCPFDGYFDRQIQELEKTSGGITAQSSEAVPLPTAGLPVAGSTPALEAPPLPAMRKGMLGSGRKKGTN